MQRHHQVLGIATVKQNVRPIDRKPFGRERLQCPRHKLPHRRAIPHVACQRLMRVGKRMQAAGEDFPFLL